MALTRWETWRLVWRSLFVQVPLNYRTLQGPGYLFALWPWLRNHDNPAGRASVAAGYLNSHPVFSVLAIGALRRRFEDGDAERDRDEFSQWREGLSGPLGLTGDALIWDRWKPLVFATGVLVMVLFPTFSIWPAVAVGSLLIYDVPLFWFRGWGIRQAYRRGRDVLQVLGRPAFSSLRRALNLSAAVLAGMLAAAALCRAIQDAPLPAVPFAAAFVTTWIGQKRQWSLVASLLIAMLAALSLIMII